MAIYKSRITASQGAVTVSANITWSEHIHVEFRGHPADLLALGAMERRMLKAGAKGRMRYDAAGT